MLGLSFDDNGRYVGWSTLFNYSSEATLRASEYLPAPQKTKYTRIDIKNGVNLDAYQQAIKTQLRHIDQYKRILRNNPNDTTAQNELAKAQSILDSIGLNLDPYIKEIQEAPDDVSTIRGYVKILNAINSIVVDKHVNICYTESDEAKKIITNLINHEFTTLSTEMTQSASKNFIASHVQNVIQDLENMITAYQPVEMEDLGLVADASPKGLQATKMTLLNPTTKLFMQHTAIVGKNVVGISANGIKASFMWYYYINDIIHHPEKWDFEKKLQYVKFKFNTKRLVGRHSGDLQDVTINTLSDLNLDNVSQDIINELGNRLESTISVDNLGSQFVSAATDNMKVLYLDKINSSKKLAKMYSFMISLGFNLGDMVSFMTSDVVSFIDTLTETDRFNDFNIPINDAIALAKGDSLSKYAKFQDKIQALRRRYNLTDESRVNEINADIEEFVNLLEAANEFSNFSKLLGLNQGIPVTKVEIQKTLSFIESIFNNRLNEFKAKASQEDAEWAEEIEYLDSKKWLTNEEYREEIAEIYNHIKKCINIFDAFTSIPQFDAIRTIFASILYTDSVVSIKSKAFDKICNEAKVKKIYMPDKYQETLLSSIDNEIVANFILSENIKLPVKAGIRYLNPYFAFTEFSIDSEFSIKTKEDLAAFKYIFENTIIPLLKQGKTWNYVNGKIYESLDPEIKSNPFIMALRKVRKNDLHYYTVDLNMLTIENSTDSQQKFQQYSQSLQKLSTKEFGGMMLSDWFMLYNLIITKNGYGSDKLTTLFDTFLKSKTSTKLLNDYFKYVGDLDFEKDVELDTEHLDPKSSNLIIGFEDALISAAPIVKSTVGHKEPYVLVNAGDGLMLKQWDRGKYSDVGLILKKLKGEDIDAYLERVNNFTNYYTFGKSFSGELSKQINEIVTLGENTINLLNDFIIRGILSPIQKIC